jgi:3-isopropylmalate dehydrogenase
MKLKIAVLAGDGIGPEVTREAVRVLRAIADARGHEFVFEDRPVGGDAIRLTGTPLPRVTMDACLASDAVLLGAVGAPEFDSLPPDERPESGLLTLRRALGAYANLRPAVAYEATNVASPLRPEVLRGADILIVRELLGGLYFGEPRGWAADGQPAAAFNTMCYSSAEVERVARVAFEAALDRSGKVTSVDKANVLETSQLWRETVSRVALDYPSIVLEHMYVDACAMHLVTNPRRFDVILTENLFGDILSDEAAAITGSLGTLASASIGGTVGIFEPVHGSAPDIAGTDSANPVGAIASAALLLRHAARLEQEAQDIESAVRAVLDAGYRTRDMAGALGGRPARTSEIGRLVAEAVAEAFDMQHDYHAV